MYAVLVKYLTLEIKKITYRKLKPRTFLISSDAGKIVEFIPVLREFFPVSAIFSLNKTEMYFETFWPVYNDTSFNDTSLLRYIFCGTK
jgi:hypothetical protein